MAVTLYAMAISHPSQAARKMLDLKSVEYKLVPVLPLNQRVHLRLAGFRGGTVPALKVDGRRIQGSRAIARAADELWPEPPLFPADPALRAKVEEAERWGDERLQPVPRRLFRNGIDEQPDLRAWAFAQQGVPAAGILSRLALPAVRYYARVIEADGRRADAAAVRADLAALPELLAHVDSLIEDGTLTVDPPNAASLQILVTVRLLGAFDDLHEFVSAYRCAAAAETLFPAYAPRLRRFLAPELIPERSNVPSA